MTMTSPASSPWSPQTADRAARLINRAASHIQRRGLYTGGDWAPKDAGGRYYPDRQVSGKAAVLFAAYKHRWPAFAGAAADYTADVMAAFTALDEHATARHGAPWQTWQDAPGVTALEVIDAMHQTAADLAPPLTLRRYAG